MKILLLSRIRSGIGSSSVGSFWVSGRIRSGQVKYWVVQCRVILGFGLYRVRAGFSGRVGSGSATSNSLILVKLQFLPLLIYGISLP
jgi:hypothetical protein